MDDRKRPSRRESPTAMAPTILHGSPEPPPAKPRKATPAPEARIGMVLKETYRLKRFIGEGGMAHVFEAEHVTLGHRMAVKILKAEVRDTEEVVERFRREPLAASKCKHPGIVKVFDVGNTPDGEPFIVMEYLDGEDLAVMLARTCPMPINESVRIVCQAARALGAAHDQRIVHRDLKPENIFLITRDGQPRVKIVDFGIARIQTLDRLTRAGLVLGTPEYMSPEQARGQVVDARSDIYSLGAILFEMLAGQPPHQGKNAHEVLSKVISERPQPVTEYRQAISSALGEAVMKALSYHPELRPQTMGEFETLLETALRQPATSTKPSRSRERRERIVRLVRGHRGAAALVALTIAAIIVGYLVGMTSRKSTEINAPAVPNRVVEATPTIAPKAAEVRETTRIAAPRTPTRPKTAPSKETRARRLLGQGQCQEAARLFEELLRDDPGNLKAVEGLGKARGCSR